MSDDDRFYESREVAEILGVPPGQIAKWKHDKRVTPAGYLPRPGHPIPLWQLRQFTDPNWEGKRTGKSLMDEYRENREKMSARRRRDT